MSKQCPPAALKIWHDWIDDDEECVYTPDTESFKEFLAKEVIEWCEENLNEAQARPHLRQQMIGLSYIPDKDTEQLQRHEATLDRRFEKTLAMLMKLQEVRAMKSNTTLLDQPVISVL